MPSIIVLDTLAQEGLDMLAAAPAIEYEVRTGLKGDALRSALTEFDGAICRSGVQINADALAGNRRLKAVVRAGVGTDNIDKEAATRQGIVVMNEAARHLIDGIDDRVAVGHARSFADATAAATSCRLSRRCPCIRRREESGPRAPCRCGRSRPPSR